MSFSLDFSRLLKPFSEKWSSNLTKKISNPPELKTRLSFCMWSDLLGFGSIYRDNNWELNDSQKREVYNRLVAAHSSVLFFSKPDERVLILNDGIAKIFMPKTGVIWRGDIYGIAYFLRSCVELHMAINQNERAADYPGCRSVIAFGECIEYLAEEVRFDDFVMNYSKPKGKNISSTAKRNGNPIIIYNPKELQMNTAFSKAYILENGGSSAGLPGNKMYIDQSVIDAVVRYGVRRGYSPVWQELDTELRFYIPYERDNLNEVILGFAFDKKVIVPKDCRYSTKVYVLLKFFPNDEPVDCFHFDLREDLMSPNNAQ